MYVSRNAVPKGGVTVAEAILKFVRDNGTLSLFSESLRLYEVFRLSNLDFDECVSSETNDCDPSALCTNTEGSYSCRCVIGYEGNGRNCTGTL